MLVAAHLAYAEIAARRDSPQALLRAAELDHWAPPAAYFERLAELDGDRASDFLDAALRANTRQSSIWIAKGLAEERAKAPAAAERDLLQAAFFDHQYLPAWTLANFYFRQNRPAGFWVWARRAAALTYDDFRPLLALAQAMEADPRVALEDLGGGEASPLRARLLDSDLDYLVEQSRLGEAQQVARLLLARKSPADTARLLEFDQRQIQAGHARDALEVWNGVWNDPDGSAGANGDLTRAPSGIAFDWRLNRSEGFSSAWQPGELTFDLSGQQLESCALLERVVALDPSRRYRLRFEYVTSGLASPTGLAWELDGEPARSLPPASAWQAGEAVLALRPSPAVDRLRLAKLRLLYRREPGTIRAPGEIQLRHVSLEAL
jgi:hypothetical protein